MRGGIARQEAHRHAVAARGRQLESRACAQEGVRKLEQEYERHYDPSGRYLGGTIRYADGRTIHANTGGLEPSTIPHGRFVFTGTSRPPAEDPASGVPGAR